MATSDEAILDAIRRVAKHVNSDRISVAMYNRYCEDGDPSPITAIRRFETWGNACSAAGLVANPFNKEGGRRVSDEDAFTALRRAGNDFALKTGLAPYSMTLEFYNDWRLRQVVVDDILGMAVLHKRYGKWKDLKTRVGLSKKNVKGSAELARLDAVARAARSYDDAGHGPAPRLTQAFYDQWHSSQPDCELLPTSAVLKEKYGGWGKVKEAAAIG
nr:hypothetical protein [Rhodococcus sp. (in: high G+C Gram-positive bacteria)]